ncbi:MAG: DHA2 family efflux MFS transporter permease subunit [Rhodospirillaceae bacterium]|jgi:MFS transporter, DHA2 family, multidrug resistance protein|nr:DHA2 family efflux MFS transporter permease subunit [Rhodospirillaceae bacterium]MBT6119328.1 DHA2 family efflux MFS transporter permease subunit [Rhodospirillaceae bacterium]
MASAQDATAPLTGLPRAMAVAAGMAGTFAYVMAISGAGMVLPHMQGAFSATPDEIAWLVTSFVVASAVVNSVAGWISGRIGRRPMHLICILGFTISSGLVGLADSLEVAVLCRILQGAFGAPLVPLGQAIVVDAFPPARRGQASTIWGMGALWGGFFGPLAAGYIVDMADWPWVFMMAVPIGAATFLLSWLYVPNADRASARPMDWLGFSALTIGVGAFMLMLSRGQRLDWFESTETIATAAVAVGFLYVFVVHSSTTVLPFLPRRLLKNRNYAVSLVLMFIYGIYNYLPVFVLPLILSTVMGYSLSLIGLLLAMRAVGTFLGLIVITRLIDKVDVRVFILVGFGFLIVPQWMMGHWSVDVAWPTVLWAMMIQGVGSGIPFMGISAMANATIPGSLRTEAISLFHLVNNLGVAVGAALIFALLAHDIQQSTSLLTQLISPLNEVFRLAVPEAMVDLGNRGDLAVLSAEIKRQATMVAFNGAFLLSAVAGLAVLPILLIAKVRRAE